MIKIIVVGKNIDHELTAAIDKYQKRLRRPFDVSFVTIPYSAKNGDEARNYESEAIFQKLGAKDWVVLLDERGDQLDNQQLAIKLNKQLEINDITIVIGGAYGVNNKLRSRANLTWSLSKLVLPHQLVRLILVEQIYRSQCIINNHPYHHQ